MKKPYLSQIERRSILSKTLLGECLNFRMCFRKFVKQLLNGLKK